jgi:putative Holliday junction resolvase
LVSPHATIVNDELILAKLTDIFNDVNPIYVVVGDPKHLSGEVSQKSIQALAFADLIKKIFHGPIYLVDERLSTSSALSQMRSIGRKDKDSKAIIDQIAAVNILESAINNERSGNKIGAQI